MNLTEARQLALDLLQRHRLAHWTFCWNRRKRSLGLCRYAEKRIELSLYFVQANGIERVRETILHEIAHAMAGEKAGHGPAWKAMCAVVGCKPERCDNGSAIMPRGHWSAQCPNCGKHYSRHRRPQKQARYWCRACGPRTGPVVFSRSATQPATPAAALDLTRSNHENNVSLPPPSTGRAEGEMAEWLKAPVSKTG